MKIGVYLVENLAPSEGGNFSYYDRLIRAIDNYQFDSSIEVCFTGRIDAGEVRLKKKYLQLASPFMHRVSRVLRKTGITQLLARFSIKADPCNRIDVSRLRRDNVDVLLYPKQFFYDVKDFPFMTMNWDAGHKSTYAFPELVEGIDIREHWYSIDMQRALAIIVESEASKVEFSQFFSIIRERIEVVPLFAGGVIDMDVSADEQVQLLKKSGLNEGGYFYYPAQFWAHKNHYNLLLAFSAFASRNTGPDIKLVLTGSDKGNKDYIRKLVADLNIKEKVLLLGFVSNEEVFTFYRHARALVMPTFLGPTNMPVLEAMALGTAVICSDLSGHRESCAEGALYADPSVPEQWTEAMLAVMDDDFHRQLLRRAADVHARSPFNITEAIRRLEGIFLKYVPVRKTFR